MFAEKSGQSPQKYYSIITKASKAENSLKMSLSRSDLATQSNSFTLLS